MLTPENIWAASTSADGMATALQRIAGAAGAEGATLTISHGDIHLGAIASRTLREHMAPYASKDRPDDPRTARVNPTLSEGFRLDQDDFTPEEIDRDPFYQEFLRPRGLAWHACALISGAPERDAIFLTLRRTPRQGAFAPGDLAALTAQLPLIRALGAMTREVDGYSALDVDWGRDRSVFGFDHRGAAFVVSQGPQASPMLEVRAGRLIANDSDNQLKVGATIERAHAMSRSMSSVLTDDLGRWWLFSMTPASVAAPSALTPFLSWALLTPYERSSAQTQSRARQMAAIFGLSAAEERVAGLVGEGKTLEAAAKALGTTSGTARNHLKAIFSKVGVNRQAELVAVFSRL